MYSQTENGSIVDFQIDDEEVMSVIDKSPEFPGGNDSLWCFIESNLDFRILNKTAWQGEVSVYFIIDSVGKVVNVQTQSESKQANKKLVLDSLIENEIKRVIQMLPHWKPALRYEQPIWVKYCLPIAIPYKENKCSHLVNQIAAFGSVDEMAQFKYNGNNDTRESLKSFIQKNMKWPSQDDCFGKVYVRVVVNEDGTLSDFVILRGLDGCRGFNEEALRLISVMPRWIPAKIEGMPVNSYIIIPISFIF